MNEYDWEPVRGLPGRLPPGEHILWQGAPDWQVLLRSAFHGRVIAGYFALLTAAGLVTGNFVGAGVTVAAALLCLSVLALLAWAGARTTVYTLTNKRVVLRIGVALPKCFNLPLKLVHSADLKPLGGGHGDVALTMGGDTKLAYFLLWPHARPWRMKAPQPMLRAVPDAAAVGERIARACAALTPVAIAAQAEPASLSPIPLGAAA